MHADALVATAPLQVQLPPERDNGAPPPCARSRDFGSPPLQLVTKPAAAEINTAWGDQND